MQPVTARLNGSAGDSFGDGLLLLLEAILLASAARQLNATFTDDSGNSAPKQR
jgi:hypothetical protein